ncbi:hypothetical protein DPMN_004603 [Dreissena polymorpha]|uniref:Uncharacterized protein n=1 Tax=Dreissena polymorpha TaxID=45954 RepID=A0A9D4RT49_DREPO|nr:hypothetical protein DPMN_004603 [Dreissena polymorpha]
MAIFKQEHRLAGADRSSIFFLKVKGLSFSITKEGGCGGVGVGTGDGLGKRSKLFAILIEERFVSVGWSGALPIGWSKGGYWLFPMNQRECTALHCALRSDMALRGKGEGVQCSQHTRVTGQPRPFF